MLGAGRGAAFYVGALVGPGVLIVPALAAKAAGPASILAWALLLVVSIPLAMTFSLLGTRHPVPGGVSEYVREAFGADAASVTGMCFLMAVVLGAPAISVVGGYYVSSLTGSAHALALALGACMLGAVLLANCLGLRVSSGLQLGFAAVLVGLIAVAVAGALPGHATRHWEPFAPHGWLAVGTAGNILIWLFIGWEAMAQLAGDFGNPTRDLPRAVVLAFCVMAVLYAGLAVATITVPGTSGSRVPLADLTSSGFGRPGRDVTAFLAVALTMGTMNVYIGSAAKLASSLAQSHALPRWLAAGAVRDIPRRPLFLFALTSALLLGTLAGGVSTSFLVRATSACFIGVYLLALSAAATYLPGKARLAAISGLVPIVVLALFSLYFLVAPAIAAAIALVLRRHQAPLGPSPERRLGSFLSGGSRR